jgi:hypothetical protein
MAQSRKKILLILEAFKVERHESIRSGFSIRAVLR